MILNKKLKTLLVLALYIGFTIAIYAIVCHFIDRPFQQMNLLERSVNEMADRSRRFICCMQY